MPPVIVAGAVHVGEHLAQLVLGERPLARWAKGVGGGATEHGLQRGQHSLTFHFWSAAPVLRLPVVEALMAPTSETCLTPLHTIRPWQSLQICGRGSAACR